LPGKYWEDCDCALDSRRNGTAKPMEGGVAASGGDQLVMAAVLDEPAALDG